MLMEGSLPRFNDLLFFESEAADAREEERKETDGANGPAAAATSPNSSHRIPVHP